MNINIKLFESFKYKDACLMLELDNKIDWKSILSSIDKDDIYDVKGGTIPYGLQKRPHLTLLYPIDNRTTYEEIEKILDESLTEDFKDGVSLKIQSIGFFHSKDYEILHLKCEPSTNLSLLRKRLKSKIKNSCKHKSFTPHITIGYLKKGTAKKYCKDFKVNIKNIDSVTYVNKDKDNHYKLKNIPVNENKMWYKTIPEILQWLDSKSNMPWLWLDTETTGLLGPKKEQITQISSLSTKYDFKNDKFIEINSFDEKIKLTQDIKTRYSKPDDNTRRILGFNHYGTGKYKYKEEKDVVDSFFEWVNQFGDDVLLIAQNASFDMAMLSGRYGHKIEHEVFDTKMLIQLYFLPLIQKLAETDEKYADMVKSIGTSPRDNGLVSSSMSKIGPALGISMSGYHDALTDCRITIKMYQGIINLLKKNQDIDIMKYQVERIKTIRLK